ncbi:hypothetical protein LROSL1_2268 [Furfurilactobacillus rossiae]|uniref:hypothetical protein n=1 Tax=Furfurilactobacillus rossiae TaxID=231049 RepID=UPI0015B7BF8E|nr:hypothetical protein [Furfurilactobacillus rossiae]MCF6166362.1 hypothetical protein [Furfurilactobacillus rossiae]QLE65069.1 hypothetical protein LROSL1_2268 [Furfurilactobacillus rossiae]
MRPRNYIYILIVALAAIGVGALTVKPVAESRPATSQVQSSSTKATSKKDSSKSASQSSTKKTTPKKAPAKKISTETVSNYTLTKTPTDLPSGLASGQAPAGWSAPITLRLSSAALSGTSEQNMVRFDGLRAGSHYRIWVAPVTSSGTAKAYKIDYEPTTSSSYVPTRLLRTALTEAQQSGDSVSQLALYNVRENG